jgi:hypothetical protein
VVDARSDRLGRFPIRTPEEGKVESTAAEMRDYWYTNIVQWKESEQQACTPSQSWTWKVLMRRGQLEKKGKNEECTANQQQFDGQE